MVTRESHARSNFERHSTAAAKITIVLALVAVAGLFAHGYIRRKSHLPETRLAVRGAAMPAIAGVDFEEKEKTLILALSVSCGFCDRSIPFYQRLLKNEQRNGFKTQVVAVFPNEEAEVVDYVRLNRLGVKALSGFDFSTIGVSGTPTLLLVRADGTLINVWAGQLSGEGEEEVLRAINSA